jgi:hypothetical protein
VHDLMSYARRDHVIDAAAAGALNKALHPDQWPARRGS